MERAGALFSWFANVRSRYAVAAKAASKPGALYEFPWEALGDYKYILFLPFVAAVILGLDDKDAWCCHMMIIVILRYVQVGLGELLC